MIIHAGALNSNSGLKNAIGKANTLSVITINISAINLADHPIKYPATAMLDARNVAHLRDALILDLNFVTCFRFRLPESLYIINNASSAIEIHEADIIYHANHG